MVQDIVQVYGNIDHDPRCAGPQSEKRQHRSSQERAHRSHGSQRLGEIQPRLRHDLRRGAEALCREPLVLCAPVSRADGQAGRRPHTGDRPGDGDRAEDQYTEPPLHRRDDDGSLRLSEAAVRARGTNVLPQVRPDGDTGFRQDRRIRAPRENRCGREGAQGPCHIPPSGPSPGAAGGLACEHQEGGVLQDRPGGGNHRPERIRGTCESACGGDTRSRRQACDKG